MTTSDNDTHNQENKHNTIIIILSIILVIILIVLTVFVTLFFSNKKNNKMMPASSSDALSEESQDISTTSGDTDVINDFDKYIGLWQIDNSAEQELTIHSMDSSIVAFSLWYYEIGATDVLTANISKNIASFKNNDIEGTLTFNADTITLNITMSAIPGIPSQITETYNVHIPKSDQSCSNPDSFEPYVLQVANPVLNIYDEPSHSANIVGTITDKSKYTITEEFYEDGYNSIQYTWGKLKSGSGWINLYEACLDNSDNTYDSTSENYSDTDNVFDNDDSSNNYEDSYTDNNSSNSNDTTSSKDQNTESSHTSNNTNNTNNSNNTDTAPLDGTLIDNCIYGCGDEHSIELAGVTFHWYDRYERRNLNNTTVYATLDFYEFTMSYREYELNPSYYNNDWVITYNLYASSDVAFQWRTYDSDGYYLDDTVTGLYNGSTSDHTWLKGNCRGECRCSGFLLGENVSYAEFYPLLQ